MSTRQWRTDKPAPNHVVEVWHDAYGCIAAVWTGERWQTVDGLPLLHVTHWREA